MAKIDFDAIWRACPNSAIRHHCVLKELYNLDMTTVLAFLRANTKEDLLTAPEAIDESEQWRILLRKLGASDADVLRAVRELGLS